VLLILLLAAGPVGDAICGAWCGDGRMSACHHDAPVASPRLAATHACGAPIVAVMLPQQPGERAVHGTLCDAPPSIHRSSPSREQGWLLRDVRLVPLDRQPRSPNLRI